MEPRDPLSRATKAFLIAVLVFPIGFLIVRSNDVADLQVPIPSATAASAERITVASVCLPPERLGIEVSEDAQTVTVTVTALDYDPDNSDGCQTSNAVSLASPLGDRRLIDGATGDEVPVESR